ncbi:D-tagatose-1,6-bisphosphate aldolase subunit GatZ/KbaZ [Rhizobium aquaticum]|uniref:D-tagatose-1,6-bisphosphate aldolase subunit GatZ/KbaZ n=1 Tax=Rhizobium aquaticum TaxID=1549636 RepID=A0ABV2J4L5_9HYPH
MLHPLKKMAEEFHRGTRRGITSVCSAHPVVIAAALEFARDRDRLALIEATCNQVNQDGGYTGMTPEDFRRFVFDIADEVGFAREKIVLGGDHLGPNPWKNEPAEIAMRKAEDMIAAFARAGFSKLHLDTSMGCMGEPAALPDNTTADRAARLAAVAEKSCGEAKPVYVIGTEVPVPGGALEALDHMQITAADSVATTFDVHKRAFRASGLEEAFERVIALVVQPGIEFGHDGVIQYQPEKAAELTAALSNLPGLLYEAHSTDYQHGENLSELVSSGFAILKVGPWLTFALREALYALDDIADILDGHLPRSGLMQTMEEIMVADPIYWGKYYEGPQTFQFIQRHFSFSDRIRYYWPTEKAREAVAVLEQRLSGKRIPATLLSQYLPRLEADALLAGGATDGRSIAKLAIKQVLGLYDSACGAE